MRRPLLAISAALLLAAPSTAQADEGDIIVQRVPGLDATERTDLRDDTGVELVHTLPIAQTELVAPEDGNVAEALRQLRASGDVISAEPDQPVSVSVAAPNDFY